MIPGLMMFIHNLCLNFTLKIKVCGNNSFKCQEFTMGQTKMCPP